MSKSIISEGERYRVEAEPTGANLLLKAQGKIDEDFRFQDIEGYLETLKGNVGRVIFDLGQITDLNSCGVRAWLLFIQKIPAIGTIEFSQLSETFLEQANMVTNMLGRPGNRVDAVQVPFFCDSCRKRTTQLYRTSDIPVRDGEFVAPDRKCPDCASALQLDAHPEEYFAFLKNRA